MTTRSFAESKNFSIYFEPLIAIFANYTFPLAMFKSASLLLCFLFFFACKKPEGIQYRGLDVSGIQPAGAGQIVVKADVRVFNPNSFDVKIWQVSAQCLIKEKLAGQAFVDTLILLPAASEITVPVSATIETKELLQHAWALTVGGGISYAIQGKAKASKGKIKWNFPFTHQGTLSSKDLKGLIF